MLAAVVSALLGVLKVSLILAAICAAWLALGAMLTIGIGAWAEFIRECRRQR